jgi:carboxyl-terminal processing protease
LDEIKQKSEARIKNNAYLNLVEKGAKYYKDLDKIDRFSLNLEKYKAERDSREQQAKQFDSIDIYKNRLKISSPLDKLPELKNDTILRERRETWHKDMSNDFYLEESVNILEDIS